MPASSTVLRFLALLIIVVAIGPLYFYQLIEISPASHEISASSQSSSVPSLSKTAKNAQPPRLVLHVGLPKTATSAIQCRLSDMERHGILSEKIGAKIVEIESCRTDNFLHKVRIAQYLDQFPFENSEELSNQTLTETSAKYTTYDRVIKGSSVLQHCIDVWIKHYDSVGIPDCWSRSYQKYIRNYHELGTNTFVISNENLALPSFGNVPEPNACGIIFDNMLGSIGNNSRIDIVLTQRLHFDRMISMFGQEYDGDKFYSRPKLKRWPEAGGTSVPNLEDYINNFRMDLLTMAINCFRFASKNPKIRFKIIDFHKREPDVVTSFMEVVTMNKTLTQQLADDNRIVGTENLASERDNRIQFDRIAIEAKRAGFVPSSVPRNEVRNAVMEYFKENGLKIKDAKLKCPPSKFFEDLTNNTAKLHQMLFPHEPANVVRGRLRMFDFQPFRDIFCEVNGNATIRDELMRSFWDQYKF